MTYDGESYVCSTSHTSGGSFDATKWTKIAAKGADGAGAGDVSGPASAADGKVALFDGTTGKLIKDSGLALSGSNTGDETTATIKSKLSITTLSGSNTGDQTSIVGITGTLSEFNAALTGADFATLAGSETLTNKTLTSPVVNSPTGIVKGDVGLGNVDNTSNATERAATATLTNKRVTMRVSAVSSSGTPTVNTDNCDIATIAALATAITNMSTNQTGTPADGDGLIWRITGTATRAISWGALYEASTVALPTTTSSTDMLTVGFIWNAVTSKWRCVGSC